MQRPHFQRRGMPYQGPRHFNGRGGGGAGGGGPYYRNDSNFNKNFKDRNQDGKFWDHDRRR
jgi:hypothetical protein